MPTLRRLPLLVAALASIALPPPLRAETTVVEPLDKTTVAVTELTEAGRALPIPSPAQPVYYLGLNAGYRVFAGNTIAGDPPPESRMMLRTIARVLAGQGFLAADAQHPATQIIVCSWGNFGAGGGSITGPGPGIHFLGGDKMPHVMEENTIPGHLSPEVLRRDFRSSEADLVLALSQEDLYAVLLRAYDLAEANAGRIVQLWETRIACSSRGTSLAAALPRIVVSGQHVIGRETEQPMVANVARSRQAWVEIGESTVVDYIDLADLAKAKEAARAKSAGQESSPATPDAPAHP
ncbi:MAG: hypothetical protein QM691_13460 [Opitutaceae bacterium]